MTGRDASAMGRWRRGVERHLIGPAPTHHRTRFSRVASPQADSSTTEALIGFAWSLLSEAIYVYLLVAGGTHAFSRWVTAFALATWSLFVVRNGVVLRRQLRRHQPSP